MHKKYFCMIYLERFQYHRRGNALLFYFNRKENLNSCKILNRLLLACKIRGGDWRSK